MMYRNLRAAMDKEKVSQQSIAKLLGVHYNTVCAKMGGRTKSDFSVQEAAMIHNKWFCSYDFLELFSPNHADQQTA